MAIVKAALLDADGVYQGIVAVDEAQLTDRHVATIKACDLPADRYRWVPDAKHPDGGSFVPLRPEATPAAAGAPSLEQALAAVVQQLVDQGAAPRTAERWLETYRQSLDAQRGG